MSQNQIDYKMILHNTLTSTCPRCGKGTLFKGKYTIADKCDHCGLVMTEHDSGDGPAVFMITVLGSIITPLALWAGMKTDWPLWLHAIIWTVAIMVGIIIMLRPTKALTVSMQYQTRRDEMAIAEDDAAQAEEKAAQEKSNEDKGEKA